MHLLFDLDGTLVDSFPGISRSINQTLTTVGREPVPEAQLLQFVGKRLTVIFGTLLGAEDEDAGRSRRGDLSPAVRRGRHPR